MRRVEPKVFVIAETQIDLNQMQKYLNEVNAPEWKSTSSHGSEILSEFMGRLCYRSFKPELNPNVKKIREGNDVYLKNIIQTMHGSVLEHSSVSFVFHDVSRVFTHELVRHRVGIAISQESLRYVRLTDLGLFLPSCVNNDPKMVDLFERTFKNLEQLQLNMAETFGLDNAEVSFDYKKKVTSAMRRIAPIGLATTIGWTTNHRNLRFILQLRTHRSAEEEIRLVFAEVGKICQERWPNIYQDFETEMVDGILEFTTPNRKV